MTAIIVFCSLSSLLVLGKFLRMKIRLLQRLYLPSSVIGGLVGLAVVQLCGARLPSEWVSGAQRLPSFLINVIFATLFLGTATPKFRQAWRMALPQLCMGQLLAWGQYVIGLGLVGFLLCHFFDVPPAMGNLVEIGFEGGHGTVGGMVESFEYYQWEDGIALGYTMATVGMVLGILIGMMLINWALAKGHIQGVRNFEDRGYASVYGIVLNHRNVDQERERVEAFSKESGLPIVGEIPRSNEITRCEDRGMTVIEGEPDSEVSAAFLSLAESLLKLDQET